MIFTKVLVTDRTLKVACGNSCRSCETMKARKICLDERRTLKIFKYKPLTFIFILHTFQKFLPLTIVELLKISLFPIKRLENPSTNAQQYTVFSQKCLCTITSSQIDTLNLKKPLFNVFEIKTYRSVNVVFHSF
jgi:hypothetical protein